MKLEVELSQDSINKIAKIVADINYKKEPKREVINPTSQDFQYSVREIAKMCKQSERNIRIHIRAKLLVATKIGKSWKISQENYLKYIENANI